MKLSVEGLVTGTQEKFLRLNNVKEAHEKMLNTISHQENAN